MADIRQIIARFTGRKGLSGSVWMLCSSGLKVSQSGMDTGRPGELEMKGDDAILSFSRWGVIEKTRVPLAPKIMIILVSIRKMF